MSSEKKGESPMHNPLAWVVRACFMVLAATIALNLAVEFLRPVLPWIVGGSALGACAWIAVAVVRWRRSRW
ncbi:hypothetical protein QNN03_36605 [Streptomyces sp. GXMU-J15]|uniref:Uncharacterized protein n=1 Tax=Streptomyces fuscus TaxID=3048495 RepID=A0ABT7JAQ7_9ACTN|nr:hypothetical protein [Streptomyces fuscus]MDL2081961.1 hypothetical protein [Streptomyces fuscus]